ncbi:ATP-binding protein [Chitinophaga sp. G-6-1-13]|uniref:ATP-binding protein n=1 Tax=Chitinophaga fulva TaxID=2728842 RepID=A0A848GID1_9BACT|nr:ATP-binding protein [Chitinophaga fulva]NML38184.1 ATP-binding protein [Chitinophaga fulva]
MQMTTQINTYYQRIIDLILELYHDDLSKAIPGHCMKITGLGLAEVKFLWRQIKEKYSNINTFIVSGDVPADERFISATKLIELRNKQDAPLLVLIPSNSRTSAEDSYGNATFKEISLEGIEEKLKDRLINDIPAEYAAILKNEILGYLSLYQIDSVSVINYLLSLQEKSYSKESVGNQLYLLNLLPDSALLDKSDKIRSRLNFNSKSIDLLCSFYKPLYDRIIELPLEPDSLQKELVNFIKTENNARCAADIGYLIYSKYTHLNFGKWQIPDLDFSHIKLYAKEISSADLSIEEGRLVLKARANSTTKVRVRVTMSQDPKDISDLAYFKIILMAVNGGAGEEIQILRKVRKTASNRPYRDITVDLNGNILEEGAYFFKVWAEDEHGNILNNDDDFKEPRIQAAWEEAKVNDNTVSKQSFNYKLTCDTDDFVYVVEENPEREENQRKDKLNNVLQAYFKLRIDKLKSGMEPDVPVPSETSNIWITEPGKHTSTFHINYSDRHNYQVNLSSKLRFIEDTILKNGDHFGYVKATLKSNSSAVGFKNIAFIISEVSSIVPRDILALRSEIFRKIRRSNKTDNGVLETADIFNFTDIIRSYLEKINNWIASLQKQILKEETEGAEKSGIQDLLVEIQMLDLVKIRSKLPDGKPAEAFLLSPLHPLRLAWWVQLIDTFSDWEKRTHDYHSYRDAWAKGLSDLFEGQLTPENNPLVLVEPDTFKAFHYSGELAYGWALYLDVLTEESKNGMTSVSRQMKHYFRQLFNITKENYVETEVSQNLVVRHIKNYLAQHPYTDKLIINLFNAGDAGVFADSLVELEREIGFQNIKYEVRIFKGDDKIIEHGEALRTLINPESNISEEAEAFSQPSANRLFPKMRFSINSISDYLKSPTQYSAHLSFLIGPFSITVELTKPYKQDRNFYLNGLIVSPTIAVDDIGSEIKWNRYIKGNEILPDYSGSGTIGVNLFGRLQAFIAGALASRFTESIPSTQLRLNDKDKVLLTHLHDYSDWVITFDKNLGPQVFDQPSKDGKIPFLLDYVPGEEITGISSYLTTRPTSEILGLLGPHFEEFNVDIHDPKDEKQVKILLEDLRAVSSSLVLQLNSSKNKAFEVIGSAFTKRVLEKKGLLEESFLIPIDLHHNLFENLPTESKSRADNLLVSINPESRDIQITVIEVKCRRSLGVAETDDLKTKMRQQIENTILALRLHFDPEYHLSFDRLDREIKNKELKSLLCFYLERAYRYEYLNETAYVGYNTFLQTLNAGFKLSFKQLGLIFNFSAEKKHHKESIDDELTFFTFGGNLIEQILDPASDLNTKRLEDRELGMELSEAIGMNTRLRPYIQKLKSRELHDQKDEQVPKPNDEKPDGEDGGIAKRIEDPLDNTPGSPSMTVDRLQEPDVPQAVDNDLDLHAHPPDYDILIGKNSESDQYGILGESVHGKKIAIDLSETNTISLFGVQGGGKSYTIGTISEMVLKHFNRINKLPSPLAGVIFHYSESMDYEPEFTSMKQPNDKEAELKKLKERYDANPDKIEDVIILTPKDKVEERRAEYPSIEVKPIAFNSKELNVQDWMFLLGAVGNDSTYIKQLKAIMKELRKDLSLDAIAQAIEESALLSNAQKALARQKLSFAREYIDDKFTLRETLKPGRLIIVDLRDEFIVKDEALGLFVIMLNIFSAVKNVNNAHFNKFIVFDEAHKYMDNKDLTGNIVTAIREMRHKGVSIMIASQDPPSLPNEIIELSSIVLLHKFNSPQWLKHIQKSITQLSSLAPTDMSSLSPGEGFLWATKATDKGISSKPLKISTRPRVTRHGGATIKATGKK